MTQVWTEKDERELAELEAAAKEKRKLRGELLAARNKALLDLIKNDYDNIKYHSLTHSMVASFIGNRADDIVDILVGPRYEPVSKPSIDNGECDLDDFEDQHLREAVDALDVCVFSGSSLTVERSITQMRRCATRWLRLCDECERAL